MILNKFDIKDIAKVLLGLNIICLLSYVLFMLINIIHLSNGNLFYLLIFLVLFIAIFLKERNCKSDAAVYYC